MTRTARSSQLAIASRQGCGTPFHDGCRQGGSLQIHKDAAVAWHASASSGKSRWQTGATPATSGGRGLSPQRWPHRSAPPSSGGLFAAPIVQDRAVQPAPPAAPCSGAAPRGCRVSRDSKRREQHAQREPGARPRRSGDLSGGGRPDRPRLVPTEGLGRAPCRGPLRRARAEVLRAVHERVSDSVLVDAAGRTADDVFTETVTALGARFKTPGAWSRRMPKKPARLVLLAGADLVGRTRTSGDPRRPAGTQQAGRAGSHRLRGRT